MSEPITVVVEIKDGMVLQVLSNQPDAVRVITVDFDVQDEDLPKVGEAHCEVEQYFVLPAGERLPEIMRAFDQAHIEPWDGPVDSDGMPCRFVNHYRHCGQEWSGVTSGRACATIAAPSATKRSSPTRAKTYEAHLGRTQGGAYARLAEL